MKVSKNTSECLWGLIKVGISILKQTPGPPSGFLVKIINPLEDMKIRLLQISQMIQIQSLLGTLPGSANYPNTCFRSAITWVHNSLASQCCDGFRTLRLGHTSYIQKHIEFYDSQCDWQFMGLCWVDQYCLQSGQSCQWKKKLEQTKSGLVVLINE